MYDLISIGTLGVDMYFKGDSIGLNKQVFELSLGGKYFVDAFHLSLGGGAGNVAIGVQKHGLRTALIAKIGKNSFRKMIEEKLSENNVSHLYCQYEDDFLNISSILLAENGERTVINYQTHHQHFIRNERDLNVFLRAKSVFMGNLPDVSYTEKLYILRFLKRNRVLTFLNIGAKDCARDKDQLSNLFEPINVLFLNSHEFSDAVKKDYKDINLEKDVRKLMPVLEDKLLVVTDGEKGSYAYFENDIFYQPSVKAGKIIDATGAGDGYTAGFISEYLRTRDIKKAMNRGANYAAKILGVIGAN